MLRRIELIQSQNIGTALVNFDYNDLDAFSRVIVVPQRADLHFVHISSLVVPGVTTLHLGKVFLDSATFNLSYHIFPLHFGTLRLGVQRESGAPVPFASMVIFDDGDYIQPQPAVLYQKRVSLTAGSSSITLIDHPVAVYRYLAIAVTMTQAGRVMVDWIKQTADVTNVPVVTLTAAASAQSEIAVAGHAFDLRLFNDGAATNTIDVTVRAY